MHFVLDTVTVLQAEHVEETVQLEESVQVEEPVDVVLSTRTG